MISTTQAETMNSNSVMKSYDGDTNPIVNYCSKYTVVQHDLQKRLHDATLNDVFISQKLGAPEVLTLGQNFIRLVGGNKVLDIGTFTGANALAWALAVKDDGKVYTLDYDHSYYEHFGLPIIKEDEKLHEKIIAIEGIALDSLKNLLHEEHEGTFDFAFIDSEKPDYCEYYDICVKLVRSGGVILVDNALWQGKVVSAEERASDEWAKSIHKANEMIYADTRTNSALVNLGDGLHIVFKK